MAIDPEAIGDIETSSSGRLPAGYRYSVLLSAIVLAADR
jgi:hypothetical protein